MEWVYTKNVDGLTFVPVTYPLNKPDGILIEDLDLPYLINYIKEKKIKKAFVQGMSRFDFLKDCPSLEHLGIQFRLPFCAYKTVPMRGNRIYYEYDLSSLYHLPSLKSLTIIDLEEPFVHPSMHLDISKLPKLEMYYGEHAFVTNLDQAVSLRSLNLDHYSQRDFTKLYRLKRLDTIGLTCSKLYTLDGCEAFHELMCLYLHYNRSLKDISALSKVKETLRALRIENCPKIEDFSVLGELENLELLELSGSNVLPSLDFLKTMKNLKLFMFNMNVLNGDLTPCLNVSHVYSEKNRRHYNLKDEELPKGKFVMGNKDIEEWRRLE